MKYQIVADSSSNVFSLPNINYTSVPMKILVGEREYTDAPGLDLRGMVDDLKQFKGKSGSSCPNVQDWLDAFGDAENVFCVTITKNLSGSYNAASQAAQTYMDEHPGRKVYVFDSLSAGPELMMIVDKVAVLIAEGCDYDTIVEKTLEYHNHNHTIFCLSSLTNLARNGRVSPAAAKIVGMLGIRVVGEAQGGQIVPVHKPRGDKKAMQAMLQVMAERGLRQDGLVRIAHCYAEEGAEILKAAILARHPECTVMIEPTTALCSYYAEVGGLIVGYEGGFNAVNDNTRF